jgi:predicted membrane protein
MAITKRLLFSLFLAVIYIYVVVNIAILILFGASLMSIPYYASIVLVALFFVLELILFFSDTTSLGIFILSIIFAVPYIIFKHVKYLDIPKQIKKDISKISCRRSLQKYKESHYVTKAKNLKNTSSSVTSNLTPDLRNLSEKRQ